MTEKLSDKEKAKRSRIREFRKADPKGLGPYNIIWESRDPHKVSHVRLHPKERQIHIAEGDTKDQVENQPTAQVLAHEIAHARTLKSQVPSWDLLEAPGTSRITRDPHGMWYSVVQSDPPGEEPYPDKVFVWREAGAVLHQLAKGWELERWSLLAELHDAATYFGKGTLTDAKRVGRKILEMQAERGLITKEESRKAIQEIDAIEKSEWDEYKDSPPHIGGSGGQRYHRKGTWTVKAGTRYNISDEED